VNGERKAIANRNRPPMSVVIALRSRQLMHCGEIVEHHAVYEDVG